MEKQFSSSLTHIIERTIAKNLVSYLGNQEVSLATIFEIKQKLPREGWKYLLYHMLEELCLFPRNDPKNTRLNFALNREKVSLLDEENLFPWEEIHEACLDKRKGVERLIIVRVQMARKLY